jgi:hypothetical protein
MYLILKDSPQILTAGKMGPNLEIENFLLFTLFHIQASLIL